VLFGSKRSKTNRSNVIIMACERGVADHRHGPQYDWSWRGRDYCEKKAGGNRADTPAWGGRKTKRSEDSTLLPDLERLAEPATRGDPMRVLRWTSKSLRHLSEALHG
jgi:hypothetical protein